MKLYTSYYASPKVKQLIIEGEEDRLVSISRVLPHWFVIPQILSVAPSSNLVWKLKQGVITEEQFTSLYKDELNNNLDITKFKDNMILLCYEKSTDFCHRHILADVLREKGIDVKEL